MNAAFELQTPATEKKPAEIPNAIWEQIVPRFKEAIAREYETLPEKWGADGDHVDWMRAALQYIRSVEPSAPPPVKDPSWLRTNITGFMVVVALLAIIFSVVLVVSAGGAVKQA